MMRGPFHVSTISASLFVRLGLVCAWLGGVPAIAHGSVIREDIGELRIHDLLIRPNFSYLTSPPNGAFSMGESSFALRWELEDKYSGVVRIGPRSLLNPTARYTPTVNSDITFVEAFAEYDSIYGRVRAGMLPVGFGYEGQQWERDLIFPRALLFQKRVMMLRDVGVSYDVSENGFFTGLVVHNGESGQDLDGQLWYTARWGYRDEDYEIGAVGQTGETKPSSTMNSGDLLAGVDPNLAEKWRIGGLYANITQARWYWTMEFYMGDLLQQAKVYKFHSGHTDFGYDCTKSFSTHLRYDEIEPFTELGRDMQQNVSLGLTLSNRTKSSNLTLVSTKVFARGYNAAVDQLLLIWNLSPRGIVRF